MALLCTDRSAKLLILQGVVCCVISKGLALLKKTEHTEGLLALASALAFPARCFDVEQLRSAASKYAYTLIP